MKLYLYILYLFLLKNMRVSAFFINNSDYVFVVAGV